MVSVYWLRKTVIGYVRRETSQSEKEWNLKSWTIFLFSIVQETVTQMLSAKVFHPSFDPQNRLAFSFKKDCLFVNYEAYGPI